MGLKIANSVIEKLGLKKALADALSKAKPDDVITYDDKWIGSESGDGEFRKKVADHNTEAMGDKGKAYRGLFEDGFHGTANTELTEFSNDFLAQNTGSSSAQAGHFITSDPSVASRFGRSGQVIPVSYRNTSPIDAGALALRGDPLVRRGEYIKNPDGSLYYDWRVDPHDAIFGAVRKSYKESNTPIGDWAKLMSKEGMTGVKLPGTHYDGQLNYIGHNEVKRVPHDVNVLFNPSNIRSRFAAFDPAKADSPNLLASAAPLAVGAGLLGQSDDADANPLQAVLKTIAREGLPKNTIERVIQRYPELAKGDGVNLTGPQKSEITRFTKSLGNPAVRRREALRNTGDTYGQVEDLPDRNIIRPSDLMGNVLVPTVGDRSRTGVVLNDVGGVPLDRPVAIEGGPDFTRQRHGTGLGWASMKGAAAGKQANIDKAAEATDLPPVGVYSAMGLDAINFSTPVAESMVAQIPALRIPQKDIQAFNNQVRKVAPDFVGLDSPDVMDQIMGRGEFPMEGAGALRKAVVGEMSKASWANKGFPRYEDVDAAVNMPELRGLNVGDSGYSMYNAIPGADIIEGAGHQSYSHGIAGDYAGGFDVSVPPNIMFPKTFNSLSQKINVAGDPLTWDQQVGSLRSAHLWEVPDQQWVDNVSDYMMRHGSKNYGSANPYYLAGLATGTATLPTAMEQLQLGNPQPQAEAVPARFPMLHNIANKIDNYQDPTGLLLNTSGTADWLRQFGERGNPYDKLLSAFGAAPF